MKPKYRRALLILVAMTLTGCGDAPTEPGARPPTPTPWVIVPTPPPLNLKGVWTGQVSLWGDWIHDCTAVENIRVEVGHFGESVSMHIPTSCLGTLWVQGKLSGTAVTFDAWTPSEEKYAHITGQVTSSSIRASNRSSNFGMSLVLTR